MREGNQLTAYNGTDGLSWFYMGSQETGGWNGGPLKPTLLVGLAVSRHPGDGVNPSGLTATAEFRQFQLQLGSTLPFSVVGASSRGNPTGVLLEFNHPVGPNFDPSQFSISGANVNSVSPGWIMTERQLKQFVTPAVKRLIRRSQCVPRLLQPEDIAEVVLFLASDASRAITGQNILAYCGWAHS